jgi:hypothetical protein
MNRLLLAALFALAAASHGCGASPSSEGGSAAADTRAEGGSGIDSGTVADTASTADTTLDSGSGVDSGTAADTTLDSGSGVDSGTAADTTSDSGSGVDSGTAIDTTSDSGSGSGDTSPPIPLELLFVGNSYTYYNDLDQLVASFATSLPGAPNVTASRVASGGYRLPQHEADAAREATPLAAFLGAGPYPAWTFVVLQDQSQIPGFPESQPERIDSIAAAVALAARAHEHGATTLLFQTWGRRNGDASNPDRFPDFVTMNNLLAEGYAQMEQAIRAAGHPVRRVPVGAAFAAIRDGDLAAGKDPLDSASLFSRLFVADGSHPSLEGSYLAATTFVCTLGDSAAPPFAFSPSTLDAADAARLQAAGCAAARSLAPESTP